jgi:hypothetical protein
MKPVLSHYEEIVREVTRLEDKGPPFVEEDDGPLLPRSISLSDGQQIFVSAKIDKAIAAIARSMRSNAPGIRFAYSQADWTAAVRKTFGDPLAALDLSDTNEAAAKWLKRQITASIAQLNLMKQPPIELAFGTTWIDVQQSSLEVGPAKIEARDIWATRLHVKGQISKTTLKRLQKFWAGKKPKARKPSWDQHAERSIIDTVGDAPFVISVVLQGFSSGFTEDRGARIARLVQTAVSLMWETSSSVLRGLHLSYDDLPARRTLLWLRDQGPVSASYKKQRLPSGPRIELKDFEHQLESKRPMFRQIGAVATYIATGVSDPKRTEAIQKLEIALRWFYEGCRADESLLAVTHFASALDTLAGGSGGEGILLVLRARTGLKADAPLHADGLTTAQIVRDIYGTARSQFLHGNTKAHLEDWTWLRPFAELLARRALVACLFDIDKTPTLVDFTM